jgi:hypothetical protein
MNGKDDHTIEDELLAKAARLPTSVSPERDLWPDIERAVSAPAAPQRSAWNSVWAQAAVVLLLIGGSSGITYLSMSGDDATVPGVAETPQLVFEPVSASFGSQYTLGPDYVDARRVLTGNIDAKLDSLSPEARAEIVTNMQTIRQAIQDINIALAEEPDSVLLQELLLETYRNELSLMIHVDSITRDAMYRGDI